MKADAARDAVGPYSEVRDAVAAYRARVDARLDAAACADALLVKHGLTVPELTRDQLRDTILRARKQFAQKQKSGSTAPDNSPKHPGNDGWRSLRSATLKLLHYGQHPARDPKSERIWRDRIIKKISMLLEIELAIAKPRIAASQLIDALRTKSLRQVPLKRLLRTLDAILARDSDKGGRPMAEMARIIRGCYIVWRRAGCPDKLTWCHHKKHAETLEGKLPAFVRDVLSECGIERRAQLSDVALRDALLACREDQNIARTLAKRVRILVKFS